MNSKIAAIHRASVEILKDVGIAVKSESTLDILRKNRIRVQGETAYFTEAQIKEALEAAPAEFDIKARNPKYDIHLDQNAAEYAPGYGCTRILERDGSERPARREDFIKLLKLIEVNEAFNINGGILVQPDDIPAGHCQLIMMNDILRHSEKCLITVPGTREETEMVMEMLAIVFGVEDMRRNCRSLTLINTTSPLRLDDRALGALEACGKYNQGLIITPGPSCGTVGPVTPAGTLALGNAEALAAIVIAQLVRPGLPVVYGLSATPANFKTAGVDLGSPEYCLLHKYSAALARFYNLPSRTGGAQVDAKKVSAQSGYQSAMELFASRLTGANLMMHAAGIMDCFNSVSYDKMMCDFELISRIEYYFKDIEVNEATLLLSDIKRVGIGGEYLSCKSTVEHCRTIPWFPTITPNGYVGDGTRYERHVDDNIDRQIAGLLAEYVRPEMEPEALAGLDAYLDAALSK